MRSNRRERPRTVAVGITTLMAAVAIGGWAPARAAGAPVGYALRAGERVQVDRATASICAIGVQARFTGRKNLQTGVISGAWSFAAATTCSLPMLRLDLQAVALLGSKVAGAAPAARCQLCKGVTAAATVRCARCNGTWTIRSHHTILLPVASLVVLVPPGCHRSATTIDCTAVVTRRL
jgi:hypothetical protein